MTDQVTNHVTATFRADRLVVGGDAMARDADGRVVFIAGALPGDVVTATVTVRKKGYSRAELDDVVEPGPDRVDPPCPAVAAGCGGCTFQHASVAAQRRLKVEIIRDALRRQGGITDPPLEATVELPDRGYRTTVRVLVRDGRPAFRRRHGHDAVPVPDGGCLVTHSDLDALLREGDFTGASEVQLRVGARTGERLAVIHPDASRVVIPADVTVIDSQGIAAGRHAHFHEEAGGRRWQIDARAFFQARADGADALVDLARDATGSARSVLDLYGGVGLLGGCVAATTGAALTVVEGNPGAVHSARRNLADLDARIVHEDVRNHRPTHHDLVIADPSRAGLAAPGVGVVVAAEPDRVVLVSCDAAALGRDARLLTEAGFWLRSVTPVDLFPHTVHVEVVSVFDRR